MRASFWIRCALSLGLCVASIAGANAQMRGYAPGVVIVQYRDGITVAPAPFVVESSHLANLRSRYGRGELSARDVPRYTSDDRTNQVLLECGVVRVERIFGNATRMRAVYRLHLIGARVQTALAQLRALPTVAYASPDWYVSPMSH